MHEARLYEPLEDGAVRCGLCQRRCLIAPGQRGFCQTRRNDGGQLQSLVYGRLAALESRPIEIKPFFHLYPGSTALTYCAYGCNLRCAWCQNWHLSRTDPLAKSAPYLSPEDLVEAALRGGDQGLCASFSEPALLHEYNLDAFPLAKRAGLYTCYVSNGMLTAEALEELAAAGLDAIKIDVKGDTEVYATWCGAKDVEGPWATASRALALGLHMEIVHLVVTGVNDGEDALSALVDEHLRHAGPDVPLHFTRYYPAYKMDAPATPISTLERAYEMAKAAGVRYPYLGNVTGHPGENTWCPRCGQLLIERRGYTVARILLTAEGRCPGCGETVPVRRYGEALCLSPVGS
ncbi:MAG: AmmeMemoRadiSam system radical SAM enzyme [Chloroflexi bacterium]|nr:AmmeMemoRadiSam system radical SAM enzyme [Chloroflexota bacterium]